MIEKEEQSPETVRAFISCLGQEKRDANELEQEYVVISFGILAQNYKENMKDSFDRPPSLVKTIQRITAIISKKYLSTRALSIQKAIARVFLSIREHCVAKLGANERLSLVYSPLMALAVSGTDPFIQKNCFVIIEEYLNYLLPKGEGQENKEQLEEIHQIFPDLITCFLVGFS